MTYLIIITLWVATGYALKRILEPIQSAHWVSHYNRPSKWRYLLGGPVWGLYELSKWKLLDRRLATLQMRQDELRGFFAKHDLHLSRMIAHSKTAYRVYRYEEGTPSEPVFNANIISKQYNGKIWHGDLDLVPDEETLQKVANEIGDIAILREKDARFEHEGITWKAAQEKAVKVYKKK